MGTVRVRHWSLRCVTCDFEEDAMLGDSYGSYDAKKLAIAKHRQWQIDAEFDCSTGDVGVEVEEAA